MMADVQQLHAAQALAAGQEDLGAALKPKINQTQLWPAFH